MKFATLFTLASVVVGTVQGIHISQIAAEPTESPHLEKRYRDVVVNPKYKELQDKVKNGASTTNEEGPKPWVRTISSTKVEIVTPTVIASVTFNGKPPKTTNGLEPWVSLNKDGTPKTIKPKIKNGIIANGKPTYGTWFATATTATYDKAQLKAHNMAEDEIFEEVTYVEEDPTEHALNPLIRCTPDFYHKRGQAKDITSEPFCFPRDNQVLKMDKTHFVTWYSNFFGPEVEKVKMHLSYVRESGRQKGLKKRSSVLEKGGVREGASFFTSEWIPKSKGFFPLTIEEEWFGETDFYKKIIISLQPDNVDEQDFDHLKNPLVVEIAKGAKVNKDTMVDLKKLEEKYEKQHLNIEIEDGIDYEKYYLIIGMPTAVMIAAALMYAFVYANRFDLSHLKKRKFARDKTTRKKLFFKSKRSEYQHLPQFNNDIEMTKND